MRVINPLFFFRNENTPYNEGEEIIEEESQMEFNKLKEQMESTKKVIEINGKRMKKSIKENQQKIDKIKKGENKMNKQLSTKKLVIFGAVLAGTAFLAGRKEGIQVGFELSKHLHMREGYNQAFKEIMKMGK